jgi:sugar (pentulose or hexulose) kinase
MTLLGIDIGTTHCKAGLFDREGRTMKIASRPTITARAPEGFAYFDPETVWTTITDALREVSATSPDPIQAVGIASMAESGLLIDHRTGQARTPIIPWFERAPQVQADQIAAATDPESFYRLTGLHISYKYSLAKLLWLRERDPSITDGAIWLSVADYIAYRLTGAMGTDYSLACRTVVFDIARKQWDEAWLRHWNLSSDLFPSAQPSGTIISRTRPETAEFGIPAETPVAIGGHDHLCAALAAGVSQPGEVFDSIGTAEVLIGSFPQRPPTQADYLSGLASGCHVIRDHHYWLGSLSTSGGSIEWLREILNAAPLSYEEIIALVNSADAQPTGILFFPYLLGSSAPHSDPMARGAWIGLHRNHTRADLAKAVLEGTAYEIEVIRRAGEQMTGQPITQLIAAGGGTRNRAWMQIKADVSGCPIRLSAEPDLTLLGAALAAGIGCGLIESTAVAHAPQDIIEPDHKRHAIYRALFEQGYLALQDPLRRFSKMQF